MMPKKRKLDLSKDFFVCITNDDERYTQATSTNGTEKRNDLEMTQQPPKLDKNLNVPVPSAENCAENAAAVGESSKLEEVYQKRKNRPKTLTKCDVIASMYALDKEDQDFCEQEKIGCDDLSRYFTNASRSLKDHYFTPAFKDFDNMLHTDYQKIEKYYQLKVQAFKESHGINEPVELAPTLHRFPHDNEESDDGVCFFTRDEFKVGTRGETRMLLETYKEVFDIRQTVLESLAFPSLMIHGALKDLEWIKEERQRVKSSNEMIRDKEDES